MDLYDVFMMELNGDPCLIDKHLDEFVVLTHRWKNALNSNDLLEALDAKGLGLEHLGHASDIDPVKENVLPKPQWLGARIFRS